MCLNNGSRLSVVIEVLITRSGLTRFSGSDSQTLIAPAIFFLGKPNHQQQSLSSCWRSFKTAISPCVPSLVPVSDSKCETNKGVSYLLQLNAYRFGPHFSTLAMSSRLYHPTDRSLSSFSFFVVDNLRCLRKRSCQNKLIDQRRILGLISTYYLHATIGKM